MVSEITSYLYSPAFEQLYSIVSTVIFGALILWFAGAFFIKNFGFGEADTIRKWVYIQLFCLYDGVVLLLTIALPLLPFTIGPMFSVYQKFYQDLYPYFPVLQTIAESENPSQILGPIWFLLALIFIIAGFMMTRLLVNPADYNLADKGNIFANGLDRVLNYLLKVRKNTDLEAYEYSYKGFEELELDTNNLRNNLGDYEEWRWGFYKSDFLNILNRRILIEAVIFVGLFISLLVGLWLNQQDGYSESNQIDDALSLIGFFGMICWVTFVHLKRRHINIARKYKINTENITTRFLPKAKDMFKKQVISPMLQGITDSYDYTLRLRDQSIDSSHVYTSPLFGFKSDSFFKKENLIISDEILLTHDYTEVRISDIKVSKFKEEQFVGIDLQGVYIETEFNEKFNGKTVIITNNKLYNTRKYINIPNHSIKDFATESVDFNKQFTIYSDDQIEARLALKTNVMYNLLRLARINKNIFIRLENNKAYIFLDTKEDFFEYDYFAKHNIDIDKEFQHIIDLYDNQLALPVITSLLLNPRSLHKHNK